MCGWGKIDIPAPSFSAEHETAKTKHGDPGLFVIQSSHFLESCINFARLPVWLL